MSTYASHKNWRRSNFLFPSLLLMITALFIVAIVGLPTLLKVQPHVMGQDFEFSSALLGVWLTLVIIAWSSVTKRFDPFELPTWISINTYFQIVVNVWLLQRDFTPVAPWLQQNYGRMSVRANALFAISLTMMWLAYAITYQRIQKRHSAVPVVQKPLRLQMVVIIWVITWVLSAIAVAAGVQGYLSVRADWRWQNYYNFMLLVNSLTGSILLIRHFRNPTRLGWLWLVFLVIWSVGSSLIIGTKGAVLTIVWIFINSYYATRKLNWRWLVVGGLVAILVIPSINLIRASLHSVDTGGGVVLSDRFKIVSSAAGQVVSRSWSDLYDESRDTLEDRQSGIFTITQSVLYLHPAYLPYVAKDTLEYIAIQIIPRLIWPDKPSDRDDLFMISTRYLGLSAEYSFSDIGLFADSFRIGGWFSVVLVFSALGVFSAVLYRRGPAAGNLEATVLYIIIANDIIRYTDAVPLMILRIIQMGGLLWLLLHFVFFDHSTRQLTALQVQNKQRTAQQADQSPQ